MEQAQGHEHEPFGISMERTEKKKKIDCWSTFLVEAQGIEENDANFSLSTKEKIQLSHRGHMQDK